MTMEALEHKNRIDQMEEVAKNIRIRYWYMMEYPTDELRLEINENATFYGLFETLDAHEDVYAYIGVGDSVVRERVFGMLARIMCVDYDYIYSQWAGR